MIKTKEREIDGVHYTASSLPARKCLRLATDLMKIFGPALGRLAGGSKIEDFRNVDSAEVDGGAIAAAAEMLVNNLDSDKVESIVMRILETTSRVDPDTNKRQDVGKPETFDLVYSGNLLEMIKAVGFGLEASLGDFFGKSGISRLVNRASKAADHILSSEESSTE
jgi:hypothetical protein